MKLWAKIRLSEDENTQQILQAFFKEFYGNSSILVKDKKVFLEITFDEQNHPTEIPAAIGVYKDIEFGYGELPEEAKAWCGLENEPPNSPEVKIGKEDEKKEVQPTQQDPTKKDAEGDGAKAPQPKPTVPNEKPIIKKNATNKQPNEAGIGRRSKKAPGEIPGLNEIAEESDSFNTFIDAVANWFEIGNKRTELFRLLVKTAVDLQKVNWVTLAQALENQDIQFGSYDKIYLTRQVGKKLNEIHSDGGILSVIKIVAQYHDFEFTGGNTESKIEDILISMGLEKETPENQEIIMKIANAGAKSNCSVIDMEDVCAIADLGDKIDITDARMIFARFVDGYYENLSSVGFIQKLKDMLADEV